MKELIDGFKFLEEYTKALKTGIDTFTQALPVFTQKQIETEARRQLNSTRDNFLSAVTAKVDNYVLVVELDPDNWLANAVENGISGFDMREGLLNGKNAKISKKGFRYASIPMDKDPNRDPSGSPEAQDIQSRIQEVLLKPKYDRMKVTMNTDGTMYQSQKVVHDDAKVQGLYRTRKFDSPSEFHSGKKPNWQFVMFRTISDNPLSASAGGWQHPGIKPANIFRKTERWLYDAIDPMLEGFIKSELEKISSLRR